MSGDGAHTVSSAGRYGLVAIATSAGGINALSRILGALPAGLPVPILVVLHLDPQRDTAIADILGRRASLRTKLAAEGERIVPGTVYIAPPDRHLVVGPDGGLSLTTGEPVHFVRPSADLLFESVATSFGPRILACVLTGSGQDGANGAAFVKSRGGAVIVEDPASAEFKGMPEATVASGSADYVLPLGEIAGMIRRLVEVEKT